MDDNENIEVTIINGAKKEVVYIPKVPKPFPYYHGPINMATAALVEAGYDLSSAVKCTDILKRTTIDSNDPLVVIVSD
jgi:hypothetical protein